MDYFFEGLSATLRKESIGLSILRSMRHSRHRSFLVEHCLRGQSPSDGHDDGHIVVADSHHAIRSALSRLESHGILSRNGNVYYFTIEAYHKDLEFRNALSEYLGGLHIGECA